MPRDPQRPKNTKERTRDSRKRRHDDHEPARVSRRALTVAVVGAGRVGTALALALADAGHQVNALVARRPAHARRAARLFPAPRPAALAAAQLDALPPADLLLIATPDDQIAATAKRLARIETERARHAPSSARVALHTSGALSSDELDGLRATGFAVGSLHPLVAVSDARTGARALGGAFFCVEGDARAVRLARQVVRALGGRSLAIRPESKALYHAAAVLAAGHTVALFDVAAELLVRCGVSATEARRALAPLSAGALANLAAAPDPARALTGPFARGDAATVRRNLAALAAVDDKDALRLYALLGARALRLARQTGVDAAAAAEIEAALAAVLK
ncbi:MAG TPA: DUF2520 domain-containing protein [Pyrinomonadaceae bacterium]|jgi:predicted short-subunit dehydrogenase-like oxidoreductase (DUF2520 family)